MEFIQGNFRFEIIDEKEKTVKIMKKDHDTEYNGKLMIPSSVEHEGKTYSIVEIGGGIVWITTVHNRVVDRRRKGGYREESYVQSHIIYGFGYTKISKIVIPSSCKRIGHSAFQGCTKLKKIIIHDGVKRIESDAFYGCKIKKISIPASVDTISDYAFRRCEELKEVIIDDSDGIISISETAFKDCPKCKIKYKSQMGFFEKLFH